MDEFAVLKAQDVSKDEGTSINPNLGGLSSSLRSLWQSKDEFVLNSEVMLSIHVLFLTLYIQSFVG